MTNRHLQIWQIWTSDDVLDYWIPVELMSRGLSRRYDAVDTICTFSFSIGSNDTNA
ncbi:MAG: hypothetical protein ACFFCZ_29130 [Promethearchaeota archaeon]